MHRLALPGVSRYLQTLDTSERARIALAKRDRPDPSQYLDIGAIGDRMIAAKAASGGVGRRAQYPGYSRGIPTAQGTAKRGVGQGLDVTVDGGGGLTPQQCGVCVSSGNACEYDPALFCGWVALPFSSFKDQGDAPEQQGPVLANFGSTRTIEVTAERACYYRIRGIWFRSVNDTDLATGVSLLANVLINEVPQVLEIGGVGAADRIGIPSSMFDDTFWVLPVQWGILDAIENNSRPLRLQFITPEPTVDQHIIGCLFGDPLDRDKVSLNGNNMLTVTAAA